MQNPFILLSFFGVAAAAFTGGLAGWLGAVVVALVARSGRRMSALAGLLPERAPRNKKPWWVSQMRGDFSERPR